MKSWQEELYYRSPVFIQNAAVTLLGMKLKRERYTSDGDNMLLLLLRTQNYTAEEMCQYQNREFVKLARHAISNTEYYSNWAKKQGINAQDIKSLSDIKQFPVIEKDLIRGNPKQFHAISTNTVLKPIRLYTSGTTGTPLTVYTDRISRSRHYAFFSRLRKWHGVKQIDKRVTMFGRIIMPAEENKPPFWRYDAAQKNLLMSSYHLNQENLDQYYNKLVAYSPAEIFAYPSSLSVLAQHIINKGYDPIKLKLVMTTAENLLPNQKAIIQQAFDAPLVNQYGCTEMAFFASGDVDKNMLLHPEHGITEIRNESNEMTGTGNGEMIATGLVNWSMPVIRYAVGDVVHISGVNKNGAKEITEVQGRIDDVIYRLDGTPVGRLDPIFKGGGAIKAAQMLQHSNGDVELKIMPTEEYTQDIGESLISELRMRLGNKIKIAVSLCETIEKQPNGKFRAVISHYKPNRDM